jgi:hypothetical protein
MMADTTEVVDALAACCREHASCEVPGALQPSLSRLQYSLLRGYVLCENGRTVGGQAVRTTTLIGLESDNQTSTLESSENLVERAWRQMDTRKLLNVFHKGVAVLVTACEAGEHENCSAGVSSKSFKRIGHPVTISISDVAVKEVDCPPTQINVGCKSPECAMMTVTGSVLTKLQPSTEKFRSFGQVEHRF